MNEHAKEQDIAKQFRKYDKPKADKPSGAQRKQLLRIPGTWQSHARVERGRARP